MLEPRYLVFDYETYSEADITLTGAWEYSMHPTTEILCAAFRIGTKRELASKPTFLWVPGKYENTFPILLAALRNPDVQLVAHNAFFEQAITRNVFAKRLMPSKPELQSIPVKRWHCTAAGARSHGLPGSLEEAGRAFGLKQQKDMEGAKLVREYCMPKKPTKKDPSTRRTDAEGLERLYKYCARDVDAQTELFLKLPELTPMERKLWELDQTMNARGFAVDRELVQGALKLIAIEMGKYSKLLTEKTNGEITAPTQRERILKYIRKNGYPMMPDLRRQTVEEVLAEGKISGKAKEMLEIREATSRSSTSKYEAFEARSRSDGRVRDSIIFNGAHTGRDSGTGLQPQNLFKSVLSQADVELGIDLIKAGDVHTIEALYKKPMDLYASALRSCIVAAPGHCLEVGDFATIEVRVLFWLAGHTKGLEALAKGRDLYCEQAADIYPGLKPLEILAGHKAGNKDASFKRQLGKQTVLGGGFGIGVNGEKFRATCKQYGIDISLELARRCVESYRAQHTPIPIFWRNLERAAISAMEKPGAKFRIGHLVWCREGAFLTCTLPIGRKLHYYRPEILKTNSIYGPQKTLTYFGADQQTGQFKRHKTWGGKLAENCTQAVARDCLKESLLRLEAAGHEPVLPVHDEAVAEVPEWDADAHHYEKLMEEVPAWAKGLPIKVEAWAAPRYRK